MLISVLLSVLDFTFSKFRIQIQKTKTINVLFVPKSSSEFPSDNIMMSPFTLKMEE